MKRLVVFDGGGSFSTLPLEFLFGSQEDYGISWKSGVDLYTGVSAGSILGSWVALGKDVIALRDQYPQMLRSIFHRSFLRRVCSANGLLYSRYSNKQLIKLSQEHFSIPLASTDLKHTKLMIAATRIPNMKGIFFKSWTQNYTSNLHISDMIAASCSAPTYFSPYKIGVDTCIDGGILANNPAMCAYAEARRLWPSEEIRLLSIGSGHFSDGSMSARGMKKWTTLHWGAKLPGLMITGAGDLVDYQLRHLEANDSLFSYFRIDSRDLLASEVGSMDDTSEEHLGFLRKKGREMLDENIDSVVKFFE